MSGEANGAIGGNRANRADRADVLIVGVSARAFAESAWRAGYAVRALDAFGDLDLKARVETIGLRRDLGRRWSASGAAVVARALPADAVAYGANFENHPRAVRALAAARPGCPGRPARPGRRLLGNSPAALARCRDPWVLAEVVAAAGGRMPRTLGPGEVERADRALAWLRKPVRGGGGSGVRPWTPGEPLGAHELLQERVPGTLASAVFLADGRQARLLGLSRQLAGEASLGAPGFRYCGSIYPLATPAAAALERRAGALARAFAEAFGLVGVNGFDFVLPEGEGEGNGEGEGEPWVLELNPRYVASAELIERALGLSIFGAHAAACAGSLEQGPPAAPAGCWGKAVVYARSGAVAGATLEWLERDDVRDVPFPGERLERGAPVCTVFARGTDATECRARLEAAARTLEQELHAHSTARSLR